MEESERPEVEDSVERFAEKVANSLIKETVIESSSANIWSIPCSSDCHSHLHTKGSQGSVAGSSLCWTPEGNLDQDDVTTCSETVVADSADSPDAAVEPVMLPSSTSPGQPQRNSSRSECQGTAVDMTNDASGEMIPSKDCDSSDSVTSARECESDQHLDTTEGNLQETVSNLGQQETKEQSLDDRTAAPDDVEFRLQPAPVSEGLPGEPGGPGSTSSQDSPTDRTDVVHYRLTRQARQIVTSDPTGVGVLSEEIISTEVEDTTYRNKSVENLRTDVVSTQSNGLKQSLRKGLSVNDIAECSTSTPSISGSTNTKHSSSSSSRTTFLRTFGIKKQCDEVTQREAVADESKVEQGGGRKKIKSIRKTLTNMFHFKPRDEPSSERRGLFKIPTKRNKSLPPGKRALPPVPALPLDLESRTPSPQSDLAEPEAEWSGRNPESSTEPAQNLGPDDDPQKDFAASIEKVKDHGWYWGPLSGEAAERILSGEPDGSFVVRDSSDDHYIFSLTFKLNGFVRHVRIEHDQGNFSFGSFTKFKSTTIVDFIENAVEHSRSGRYLFFLHRRPVLGPMRVQLLHPVSRFKRVQSLKHLCRYVIVKNVRKDHLNELPVPNSIKTYLNTRFYYSEQLEEEAENDTALHSQDLENSLEEEEEDVTAAEHEHDEGAGLAQAVISFPGTPDQGRPGPSDSVSPSSRTHDSSEVQQAPHRPPISPNLQPSVLPSSQAKNELITVETSSNTGISTRLQSQTAAGSNSDELTAVEQVTCAVTNHSQETRVSPDTLIAAANLSPERPDQPCSQPSPSRVEPTRLLQAGHTEDSGAAESSKSSPAASSVFQPSSSG